MADIFNILNLIVFIPFIAGLLALPFKRAASWIAMLTTALIFLLSILLFAAGTATSHWLGFHAFGLNNGIFMMGALLTFLITIYSLKSTHVKERLSEYYAYILFTLGSTAGALFANDFMVLIVFWGILGITLYLLVGMGGFRAGDAAKRTLILVGGADALMIFGAAIIWSITKTIQIGAVQLPLNHPLTITAFLALLIGVMAKTGAVPLHSWIPEAGEYTPAPVMALLPASLDKLVGIYLLTRLCFNVFQLQTNSPLSFLLLLIGAATIMIGVLGALVQHNLKKLLAFHTVSQVGYMVMGIGTGIPVAVAGGIFHMFNNSIYKSLLFLTGGAVEKETGTGDLQHLGGLAKFMPITFITATVAALSISGVPPFNGFVSKWMIYQGLVELSKTSPLWIIWLLAAMFGSALTLASFIKLIHAVYLGQWSNITPKVREVPKSMWLPMAALALICIVFGIFAFSLPLKYLVFPAFRLAPAMSIWDPMLATVLLLFGLLMGVVIFWLGNTRVLTPKPAYIGGEILEEESVKVSGVDFYNTVREWGILKNLYPLAEKRVFGFYEWCAQGSKVVGGWLSRLHNGMLHTYIAWIFAGGIILFLVLMR